MQGQMKVANRKYCIFVLWTPLGVFTHKILFDNEFWKQSMESKLKSFYFDCLLPELIDPRYTRSMEIRNPPSILDEQLKRQKLQKVKELKLKKQS